MRVKIRIVFEVEYQVCQEFYETDSEEEILEVEKTYVAEDPVTIIEVFNRKGKGKFTTSVERINEPKESNVTKTWVDGTYTIKRIGTTEV